MTVNDSNGQRGTVRFKLDLQPLPGTDGVRSLRALLKVALRRFGLRCVKVSEASTGQAPEQDKREAVKHGDA